MNSRSSIHANPQPPAPEARGPEAAPRQRRGHGRTTLQDVARVAGVTSITVSRYLRAPEVVAPATAERIRAALADTGYVPNRQAGQLASGRGNIVAAIIPSIANSIFAETVQGLSDVLAAAGHELLLASTGYSLEREEEQLRAVLAWSPGALAVTGRRHSAGTLAMLQGAQAAGMPIVELWDRHDDPSSAGFAQVGFDHAEVGRAMAQHLLALGHRNLAYVDSGVAEDFRAHERGAGFAGAARAAGVAVTVTTAAPGDAFDAGRGALHALLTDGQTTAAAFANDHLASGALLEAGARGVAVPQRMALLGFGDFPIGRQLTPALSTVHPPRYEIGHEAGALLLDALQGGAAPLHRALPWTLIARSSSDGALNTGS